MNYGQGKGSFRGAKPLSPITPLSFEGEGDTGGEVSSYSNLSASIGLSRDAFQAG
ncbi:hypothetical protein ES703_35508 [subsurface metagenome]